MLSVNLNNMIILLKNGNRIKVEIKAEIILKFKKIRNQNKVGRFRRCFFQIILVSNIDKPR